MVTGMQQDTGKISRYGSTRFTSGGEIALTPSQAEFAKASYGKSWTFISRECVRQHLLLMLPLAIIDMVTIGAAFAGSCWIVGHASGIEVTHQATQIVALSTIAAFIYASLGLYLNGSLQPINEFRQIVTGSMLSAFVLAVSNGAFVQLSQSECWAFTLTSLMMLVAGPTARSVGRRVLGRFDWWLRPVVVVGSGPQAEHVCRSLLNRPWLGFRPVGCIDDSPRPRHHKESSLPFLGCVEDLPHVATDAKVCWAMIAMAGRCSADVQRAMEACSEILPNVVVVSNMQGMPALWTRAQEYGDTSGLHVQAAHLLLTPPFVKRLLDLTIIACGAVFLLPVIVAIAAAIKIKSPNGPVFYGHTRLGRDGIPICAWKFRTMVPDADQVLETYLQNSPDQRREWQALQKLKNDPRVIPFVGSFLRKFSLDELPQLWNVLQGEMSLVGPRPIVPGEIGKYAGAFAIYAKVRPGITGLWQISGRNNTTYRERVDLDVYYVTNWSPWLDLYILVRTIRTVLLREGAY